MMLEKETALNTVSQNRGLICLATILKINRTFGRGELFFLTRYKQKLYLVFLIQVMCYNDSILNVFPNLIFHVFQHSFLSLALFLQNSFERVDELYMSGKASLTCSRAKCGEPASSQSFY